MLYFTVSEGRSSDNLTCSYWSTSRSDAGILYRYSYYIFIAYINMSKVNFHCDFIFLRFPSILPYSLVFDVLIMDII